MKLRLAKRRKQKLKYLWKRVRGAIRQMMLHLSIQHLYGPQKLDYGCDDVIVLCPVRDGQVYMKSFLEHYFSLGVKHIVFLDNGSQDATIPIAKTFNNVTILRTTMPYRRYCFILQPYLLKRFGKGRWSLCVDIDEFFDYPYSDKIPFSSLIEYLNTQAYTAVVAYMLDMFSDRPLGSTKSADEHSSLKDLYTFYDISDIRRQPYKHTTNLISNSQIQRYRGGIRNTVFDTDVLLIKHPLIFLDRNILPVGSLHRVFQGCIADFTCVLLHYKFTDDFYAYTSRSVQEENHWKNSLRYKEYYEVLKHEPHLSMQQKTSKRLKHVNELIDNQFLIVSEKYQKWIRQHSV
ncbi:MAG: glycosyltransferase family 2 protein [bacterium]|nr:glycosyltransferase family 2 protein [bacterium]